jgi:hypothetical protein
MWAATIVLLSEPNSNASIRAARSNRLRHVEEINDEILRANGGAAQVTLGSDFTEGNDSFSLGSIGQGRAQYEESDRRLAARRDHGDEMSPIRESGGMLHSAVEEVEVVEVNTQEDNNKRRDRSDVASPIRQSGGMSDVEEVESNPPEGDDKRKGHTNVMSPIPQSGGMLHSVIEGVKSTEGYGNNTNRDHSSRFPGSMNNRNGHILPQEERNVFTTVFIEEPSTSPSDMPSLSPSAVPSLVPSSVPSLLPSTVGAGLPSTVSDL